MFFYMAYYLYSSNPVIIAMPINIIVIDNYEDLINCLNNNQENLISIPHLLDFNLLNNMGIELIAKTLQSYQYKYIFIANCANSIAYALWCIENGFKYILLTHPNIVEQIIRSDLKKDIILFSSHEKLIEYFENNG